MGRRKFAALVLVLITAAVMTACGSISSEKTLIRTADSHGKNTHLKTEETEDSRTCYFRDELGFEYTISSSMHTLSIDGADFGKAPSTSDGYYDAYLGYMAETANKTLPEELYAKAVSQNKSLHIEAEPKCDLASAVPVIGAALVKADVREDYKEPYFYVYDPTLTPLGSYCIAQNRFMDEAESKGWEMMMSVRKYVNYEKSPTYLRHEHRDAKDVPGLSDQTPVTFNDDPYETGVELYWFSIDGKEYFITSVLVYKDVGEEHDYYYFHNYPGVEDRYRF